MIDIDELIRKQNLCEHRNIMKVDAVVIDHYFQCQDCLKISASSTYFKYYEEKNNEETHGKEIYT